MPSELGASAKRVSTAIGAFLAKPSRCLAVSLVFSAIVVGLTFSAWVPTGVNDDWAMSNLLSGNWPGPQGLCLVLNAALSQTIYALNQALPNFNWFYALEFATVYASYAAIVYISLSRMPLPFAALSIASVTLLVLPGCTYSSNFTYVAGLAAGAGGVALLASLREERHTKSLVIAGVIFMTLAFLWRRNMFLLCVPVFGFAALCVLTLSNTEIGYVRRLKRLWPFLLVLVVFAGFQAYTISEWSQPEWKAWNEFNVERHGYADYDHRSYAKVADELEEIGVSENDCDLLDMWIHEDPEFFTTERLGEINDITTVRYLSVSRIPKVLKTLVKDLVLAPKMAFVFIPMVLLSLLCLRGRSRRTAFVIMGVVFLLAFALLFAGRLPVRVKYSLWAYAAVSCGVGSWFCGERLRTRKAVADACSGKVSNHPVFLRIEQVARVVAVALPVIALGFVLSTAARNLLPEKLGMVFDAQNTHTESYVADYIRAHPDNVFVMNTSSNSILMFANKEIAPYDADIIERTVTLGGWSCRSPYSNTRNANIDLDNPIKGLVENEDALYLSPGTTTTDALLQYLREHYYPNATYEEIDSMQSPTSSTTVYVFKFSKN